MKDLYIIDGYNVIFCLPEEFPEEDLEPCRKRLIDWMLDFGAHNHVEVIIAFDGKGNAAKAREEDLSPSFHIVYTPSRMTADSYIEKESYKRKDEYRSIYVVTSDGPEQNQVLGNGAYRIAVREFLTMLKDDKKQQHVFIRNNSYTHKRSSLESALTPEARERLERLRGGKK